MKKSTVWLIVGIGSMVSLMVLGCCAFGAISGGSGSNVGSAAAVANVDLEKLTKSFEKNVSGDSKDLNAFKKDVNDKSKGIYTGKDPVDVTMIKDGGVVGYVNKDTEPDYDATKDEKVFELQVAPEEKNVVAKDRYDNHYRYRPTGSGFFTGYLIGSMLTNQRSYYGGRTYRAPTGVSYKKPGYYNRMKSSSRSSSFRSGSRSSYRSGSRSGGFGSGK